MGVYFCENLPVALSLNMRFMLLAWLILSASFVFPQTFMRIQDSREHIYEFFPGDVVKYKLKGENKVKQNKIIATNDSLLVLDNEKEIRHSDIRFFLIPKNNYVINGFQKFFFGLGVGFVLLDTANNLLLERETVVNPKAVYISAGLITTSLLLKRMSVKKVRLRGKTIKVLPYSYKNLK